jgi:hypothetical protein
MIILENLMEPARPISISDILLDSGVLIRDVMAGSDLLHLIVGDVSGHIKMCNGAVARSLGLTCDKLLDQPLASYLVESDAEKFPKLIANNTPDFKSTFLLNFVNSKDDPYTLVCRIDVQPNHFILVGEPAITEELGFQIELNELNNQLATLARENARKTKELAQTNARLKSALEELNRTHWHLRKVAAVLPMCIACGKVKSSDAKWQEVAEYFHNNSLIVSHGCCPDCQKTLAEEWGLE